MWAFAFNECSSKKLDRVSCDGKIDHIEKYEAFLWLKQAIKSLPENYVIYTEWSKLLYKESWKQAQQIWHNTRHDSKIRTIIMCINYLLDNSTPAFPYQLVPSTREKLISFQNKNWLSADWNIWPNSIQVLLKENQKLQPWVREKINKSHVMREKVSKWLQWIKWKMLNESYCSLYTAGWLESMLKQDLFTKTILPWAVNEKEPLWGKPELAVTMNGKMISLYSKKGWNILIRGDADAIFQVIDSKINTKEKAWNCDSWFSLLGKDLCWEYKWWLIKDLDMYLMSKRKNHPQVIDIAIKEYKRLWSDERNGNNPVWHRISVFVPAKWEWNLDYIDYYYPKNVDKLKQNIKFKSFDQWFNEFRKQNYVWWEWIEKKFNQKKRKMESKKPLPAAEFRVIAIYK